MSDTPRTDAAIKWSRDINITVKHARQLERELNAASERIKQLDKPITGETSDGYHSFNELYEHRHALFLALISIKATGGWMSRKHHDGSEMEGWFIAGAQGWHGDISYHLPMRLWDACVKAGAEVLDRAPKWDGHTSKDVIDRLMKYATS